MVEGSICELFGRFDRFRCLILANKEEIVGEVEVFVGRDE
jgi:hypothetical protein